VPTARRSARAGCPCVRDSRPRGSASACAGADVSRSAAPPPRNTRRGQGPDRRRRSTHHRFLPSPGRQRRCYRCAGRVAPAPSGSDGHGKDQHAGVRLRCGERPHPESLGPRAHPGRIQRRIRRCGRSRHVPRGTGLRHRRLGANSVVAVWDHRAHATTAGGAHGGDRAPGVEPRRVGTDGGRRGLDRVHVARPDRGGPHLSQARGACNGYASLGLHPCRRRGPRVGGAGGRSPVPSGAALRGGAAGVHRLGPAPWHLSQLRGVDRPPGGGLVPGSLG
jgi:hypothetical protein